MSVTVLAEGFVAAPDIPSTEGRSNRRDACRVEHISREMGAPAGLIDLILAPLATELPEKFNPVYWLRENKDPVAFGNISGATAFQSTAPDAPGLAFTPWALSLRTGVAVGFALFSGAILFALLSLRRPLGGAYLLGGGLIYAGFVAATIATTFLP